MAVRVEICGGIASGKTSLAQLLETIGFEVALERYEANPFLTDFYQDPGTFAFETEISFLLQHYSTIKQKGNRIKPLVCDYSLFLDLAYALNTIQHQGEMIVFNQVLSEIYDQIGKPELVILLDCSTSELLRRIRMRGRQIEQGISATYLTAINDRLETVLGQYDKNRVMMVDSTKYNYIDNESHKETVRNLVLYKMSELQANT